MRPGALRSLICLSLVAELTIGGCRPPAPSAPVARPAPAVPVAAPAAPSAAPGERPEVPIAQIEAGHLMVELPDPRAAAAGVAVAPLPDADARVLLARLPALPAGTGTAPSLRPPSSPPPRAGAVQPIALPISTGKVVADTPIAPAAPIARAPLSPPHIDPQGEGGTDRMVRIWFAEPMVPLAQVGEVKDPPAAISPAVPGTWRWRDTRVLQFETAAARFPGSTQIIVTVPSGVRAVSGAVLAETVRAGFLMRPVAITDVSPRDGRADRPLAVTFDQRVDPDRIAALLAVLGPDGAPQPVRAITLAEALPLWRADPSLTIDQKWIAGLGSHVILAPRTAWPAGRGSVVLRPGATSLEGPRVTTRESAQSFGVAPPFTVRGLTCDHAHEPRMTGRVCPADSHATVELSSRIRRASLRPGMFRLDGQPFGDDAEEQASISVRVPPAAGRAAAIEIADGLVDVHGQPLVGPRRLTFAIGRPTFDPLLDAPGGLIVLDPRFQIPQWVVHAEAVTSVRVQLYRVQPKDYFAFAAFERGERAAPPGRRVVDQTHAVGSRTGVNLRVDLRPALGTAGLGHVVAIATTAMPPARRGAPASARTVAWLQVTRLGVSARTDRERIHAWVQDVSPAQLLAPRAGVGASLVIDGRPDAPRATTDAGGHAAFDLPPPDPRVKRPAGAAGDAADAAFDAAFDDGQGGPPVRPSALLLASTADDATFAALAGPFERATRHANAYWYATDDRFTYRPGETVHVKGWVRWTHDGVNPDLALPAPGEAVAYTLVDARGTQLASGRAPLSDHGGFDLDAALPPSANLGQARFTFTARGQTHTHSIAIEEFRAPAFAVTLTDDVTHGGALPLVLGERIEMSAAAQYYAGGGLPGAQIHWTAQLEAASYAPPGWDLFSFAPLDDLERSEPWRRPERPYAEPFTVETAGALSGASGASIGYGVAAVPHGQPSTLTVDATVTDVDRAAIRATSRPILVHPSSYYVGLRLRPGAAEVIEAIATDIDGNPVRGVPIDVAVEAVPGRARDEDAPRVVETQRCKLTSDTAPVACPFRSKPDLAYTAIARLADPRGRGNAAYLQVPWSSHDEERDLSVTADQGEYRPGDVARLELRSERVPATAIVTLARQGVISQRRVALTRRLTTVEVPIEVAYLQNVHVVIDRFVRRADGPHASPRPLPDHDTVELDLPVALDSARLAMSARPTQPVVEPGAPATFEVAVRHGGKPVDGAEVALLVVDEAVLAVSDRTYGDPLEPFYEHLDPGTWRTSSIGLVADAGADLPGGPGIERYSLDEVGARDAGDGDRDGGFGMIGHGSGSGGGGGGSIAMRKDFRPDAAFSPRLRTGPDGKVSLTVTMPDSLTRFRVVALATWGTRYFGKAEGTLVTQRELSARVVAPRFLTQGDAFSLPVVVQNQGTRPRTVDVAVRAANLVAAGPAGRRVTIPGGQRAEVRFPFAARARGRAVIQAIVVSGGAADASSVEVPVYEPATTESFATYGTVDDASRFEQLAVPADALPDVGGVEVELASTQLQSLTDAYSYLYRYPYECAEQRSARMIATAALSDILEAFAGPGRPATGEIAATIARDVRVLAKDQRPDGGWGYFDGLASDPFVSLQVLTALTAHGAKDGAVPRAAAFAERTAAALLAELARAAAAPVVRRPDSGELAYRIGLAASALTALAGTGADVRARAERLHALATALAVYPLDAKARLLALVARLPRAKAMRESLLRELTAATHETASAATVTARFEERERRLLPSSARTTALALAALLREAPEHALVTKLVRGLLDGRRGGRWGTTQENLAALTALRRYFDTHEKTAPAFTGQVWLGSAAYAEQAFAGRTGARGTARLGWTELPPGSTHDVAIARSGAGRMYYRVGVTYAPQQRDLPALDAGFVVRRAYTAIDDPGDVTRTADGRWKIRLGARVQVTLEAESAAARQAVALVDPLPAGLEAVNERLATAERAVRDPKATAWDHVAMRDSRAEAFLMQLAPGRHRFSYTARATTPGTFVAAPAKAEEMYSPETFGRSTGSTVVVE